MTGGSIAELFEIASFCGKAPWGSARRMGRRGVAIDLVVARAGLPVTKLEECKIDGSAS